MLGAAETPNEPAHHSPTPVHVWFTFRSPLLGSGPPFQPGAPSLQADTPAVRCRTRTHGHTVRRAVELHARRGRDIPHTEPAPARPKPRDNSQQTHLGTSPAGVRDTQSNPRSTRTGLRRFDWFSGPPQLHPPVPNRHDGSPPRPGRLLTQPSAAGTEPAGLAWSPEAQMRCADPRTEGHTPASPFRPPGPATCGRT